MGDDDNMNTERMKMHREYKTSETHVNSGEVSDNHKTGEVSGGGSEDAENGTKKVTNENKNSDKEYELGSHCEYKGGCRSGFAKVNEFNDCENENYNSELLDLEAFETLGLDPNNELTTKILQRVYCISIKRAHPGKAPLNEISQEKASKLSQKNNIVIRYPTRAFGNEWWEQWWGIWMGIRWWIQW